MTGLSGTDAPRSRTRVVAALAALAAVALLVIIAVIAWRGDDAPQASSDPAAGQSSSATAPSVAPVPSEEPSATASVAPLPPPAPPEGTEEQPVAPEQEPVAPTETATGVDGASVALVDIEGIDVVGQLPGEVSGKGVKVTVRITNTTTGNLNMDYVAVNLYTGADRLPALPIASAAVGGFSGELAVGSSQEASYVFLLDGGEASDALIGVDYYPGTPTVTFRGAIG